MTAAVCPACLGSIRLEEDQVALYEQVRCPHCETLLEVVDELPLTFEEVD